MATAVFILMVAVLVANSVVRHSETAWWRDPGALFREGGALYFGRTEAPATQQPVARPAGRREPRAPRRSPERMPSAVPGPEPVTEVFGRVPGPAAPLPPDRGRRPRSSRG